MTCTPSFPSSESSPGRTFAISKFGSDFEKCSDSRNRKSGTSAARCRSDGALRKHRRMLPGTGFNSVPNPGPRLILSPQKGSQAKAHGPDVQAPYWTDVRPASQPSCSARLLQLLLIYRAAEAQSAGAILGRRHQQILTVLVQFVSLREIPHGALRLIITATAQNRRARMFVHELIGPLPHVAGHIHRPERTGARRMRVHIGGTGQIASLVWRGNRALVPRIAPRIQAPIRALRRVLPFPLVRKPLAGPCGVSPRIFQ